MYRKENKSISEVYQEDLSHFSQPSRNKILRRDDSPSPMNMESVGRSDMQDWRAIVKDEVKREVKDRREQVGDHSFTHKRKLACGDDSVPDQFQQGMQDPASAFCEKVKDRLQDPDDYTKFMDCVHSYDYTWVIRTEF
ncbi:paired amphipathic helix Sin3-like 4 isoform X1 [Olea europaea subsp. europaea]|uniref:Paired amphipathic helix Sin3-like 4 isoform X1 n=1 Tax=Olea europaea subsp. europaea TaxID=158383 RepID=A0A8S0PC00_OLEEU|nr:paired amphipathic helix Sin3-like 4 isoform X1 [Olea europaea subsp. europaea]